MNLVCEIEDNYAFTLVLGISDIGMLLHACPILFWWIPQHCGCNPHFRALNFCNPRPTFTQFHWTTKVNMRRRVSITWLDLPSPVKEVGPTNWPLNDISQHPSGLQDTQGPKKSHPRWQNLELRVLLIDLGSQPHAWQGLGAVKGLQPHAQDYLSVVVAQIFQFRGYGPKIWAKFQAASRPLPRTTWDFLEW